MRIASIVSTYQATRPTKPSTRNSQLPLRRLLGSDRSKPGPLEPERKGGVACLAVDCQCTKTLGGFAGLLCADHI
jgi:hypothetical protein